MEPLVGILIIIVIIFILEFNKFVNLRNKIKQSRSGIDVFLNQRFDLIPNLVECVKGYAKYESETLTKIAEMRSNYAINKDLKMGAEINNELNRLMAIGEDNPNLKASDHFMKLEKTLTRIESQLQAARRVYNGDVTLYNTAISTFPNNIFAGIFGFKEEELFVIEEYKKENVNVDI